MRQQERQRGDLEYKKKKKPTTQSPVIKANGSIVSKKHLIVLECTESSTEHREVVLERCGPGSIYVCVCV